MRIAIISEYNQFTTTGGTEYYVDMLLKGLVKKDHSVIFISRGKQQDETEERPVIHGEYSYQVVLLPAIVFNQQEIKQEIVSRSWQQMFPFLQHFQPDIIHVHTLSTFFNIRHFEICHQTFPRIIFTSHVPGHFCAKGDLIKNNTSPCDGRIGVQCSVCMFSTGLKRGLSNLVSGYASKRLKTLESFTEMQVQIICVSAWQQQQLIANGYPAQQLAVIRQALTTADYGAAVDEDKMQPTYRVGYLGRLSPEKGSAFLFAFIRSLLHRKDVAFVLGIPANSDPTAMTELEELVKQSPSTIVVDTNVHAGNKAAFFAGIDCLFIPSFCIETGPIVLLEAVYYQKQVLAPGAGGPLEFAAEYPQFVSCYDWNNAVSAIGQLEHMLSNRPVKLPDLHRHFEEKQTRFIQQHLSLYQHFFTTNTPTIS
jgi:glycosyltransferase involved in cell wall biosynthesis